MQSGGKSKMGDVLNIHLATSRISSQSVNHDGYAQDGGDSAVSTTRSTLDCQLADNLHRQPALHDPRDALRAPQSVCPPAQEETAGGGGLSNLHIFGMLNNPVPDAR